MEFNWNWFMSVDFKGRWFITKGRAHFEASDDDYVVSGTLYLGESECNDSNIYAKFVGKVTDDSKVVMTVTSTKEDVPSFDVSGTMFSAEGKDQIAYTFVLTDGTTVLGFAQHSAL